MMNLTSLRYSSSITHHSSLLESMPTVTVRGAGLYYEEHGRGEPLVLVPGFGTGLWIWYRQVPAFAERFRTVVFDPQEFALAHPERTRSLILCCTSYGGTGHVPPAPETLAAIASTKGLNTA